MSVDKLWCETCSGSGTVDETLGGESTSCRNAKCPDCDGKGYWHRNRENTDELHSDDAAVDCFAVALKVKLAEARAKGRRGWRDNEPGMQQRLSDMLRAHVEKGDPRDVANFAMFLHQRGERIAPAEPAQASAQEAVAFLNRWAEPNWAGQIESVSFDRCDKDDGVSIPLYPAPTLRPITDEDVQTVCAAYVDRFFSYARPDVDAGAMRDALESVFPNGVPVEVLR